PARGVAPELFAPNGADLDPLLRRSRHLAPQHVAPLGIEAGEEVVDRAIRFVAPVELPGHAQRHARLLQLARPGLVGEEDLPRRISLGGAEPTCRIDDARAAVGAIFSGRDEDALPGAGRERDRE